MMLFHLFAMSLAGFVATPRVDDAPYIGLFAETHLSRMMGVKMREMPKLPPGIKLPANILAMMPGPPTHTLSVRLWAPGIAPDSATASIIPPTGLQAGDKLDLGLFRPMPKPTGGGESSGGTSGEAGTSPDLTIKIYWGSSDTVPADQPKVLKFATMSPTQQLEMSKRMMSLLPISRPTNQSYFYKDNWTTGYWPTTEQPGQLGENSSLVGTYSISSTFAGNSTIEASSAIDFLAPIELTSPDLGTKPPMDQALRLQWKPIPNALGIFASAMGIEGKTTLIFWTSSQDYADQLTASMDYMQMADVTDMVTKHVFLPGTQGEVTIPAGIFQNAQFASLNMIGYGPGVARDDVTPIPRIQTKTTLSLMLKTGSRDSSSGGNR